MMGEQETKPHFALFPVLIFYSFFILASILVSHISSKNPFFMEKERVIKTSHALWGLGIGLGIVLISLVSTRLFKWGKDLEKEFKNHLTPLSMPTIFGISCASALGEELLFRGALQQLVGLYTASILFGLFHFPFKKELVPWSIMAIFMGFILGLLFEKTGNLTAPILCHFVINFLNILILNINARTTKTEI